MDALTLLKDDHDKVKGMLSKLEDTTERAEVDTDRGSRQAQTGADGP